MNADGTEEFHKVKLVKPMPPSSSGIAFDVLNALRSALDQAGYVIGTAAGGSGKRSHFPFGDTLAEVQSRRSGPKSPSGDLPEETYNLMVSLKPYKGGNELLWALNKLCNSQKHEIVLPVAAHIGELRLGKVISFAFPPQWDSAKNEGIASGAIVAMDWYDPRQR